jgi:hypothetical protein
MVYIRMEMSKKKKKTDQVQLVVKILNIQMFGIWKIPFGFEVLTLGIMEEYCTVF